MLVTHDPKATTFRTSAVVSAYSYSGRNLFDDLCHVTAELLWCCRRWVRDGLIQRNSDVSLRMPVVISDVSGSEYERRIVFSPLLS